MTDELRLERRRAIRCDGAGGGPDTLLNGSRPFSPSLVFDIDEEGQTAADGFSPYLGTQGGEMAVADLLVIEQASGRAFAALARLRSAG